MQGEVAERPKPLRVGAASAQGLLGDSADRRIVDLACQASEAEERLGRLHAAIEAGTIDSTDPTLKDRIAALKAGRDKAAEALDYAKKSSTSLPSRVQIKIPKQQPLSATAAPLRWHADPRK